jgi:hypothetical protein
MSFGLFHGWNAIGTRDTELSSTQSNLILTYVGVAVSLIAGCSAIAGCIAHVKRRPPLEGVLLGLFLGPIGILIECRYPYAQRPMVDKLAQDSLRSMMTYQQSGRESSRREAPRKWPRRGPRRSSGPIA